MKSPQAGAAKAKPAVHPLAGAVREREVETSGEL